MSEIAVGKDIISFCGGCKLALSHTIVSLKEENIVGKAKCNTCGNIHNYRDPALQKVKKKKAKKKTTRKASTPVSELWMNALNNTDAKSTPFSIKSKYDVGDIIDHPKFGPGIVDEVVDNDKVSIIFRHEIKTLVHNRD